jgi:shikimate kinase
MTTRKRRRPADTHARHVVLIGMMGVGKSTIGHQLAKRMGRSFFDTDHEIVASVGMSVSDIFALHGNEWFRAKETEVLSDCLRHEVPAIISAGGGTVLAEHNRTLISSWSDSLWLRASYETILRRVGTGVGRPVLAGNPEGTIRRLLDERESLYEASCDVAIHVDGLPVRTVVSHAFRALNELQHRRS